MEINGRPYYIKSKGDVPYVYDIDTNDEVGYWSSKKGEYIMFSLYNRMMKQKYENQNNDDGHDLSKITSEITDSDSETVSEKLESESSSSQDQDVENEDTESNESDDDEDGEEDNVVDQNTTFTAKKMNTYSLVFLFLIFFVYLTLQKEFQSIYFDFIFLILINLLHTFKVFEMLNDDD
jgi:hypothetical protein